MSRPKTDINPLRAERVKTMISREGISQSDFAARVPLTQQAISRIVNLKTALTEETAAAIIRAYPIYRIEWLLGFDNYMTINDLKSDYIKNLCDTNNAAMMLLNAAAREVCTREDMPVKVIDSMSDFLILEAQLKDYANSLMLEYLKHRQYSHLWNILDNKQ